MDDAYVDRLRIVRPIGLRGALECVSPHDGRRWLVKLPLAHRPGDALGALAPIDTPAEMAEWARARRALLAEWRGCDTSGPHMLRALRFDDRIPALLCAPADSTLREMRAPLRRRRRLARHLGAALDFVRATHAPLAHTDVVAENVFFCARTGAFALGGGALGTDEGLCMRQLAALLCAYGDPRLAALEEGALRRAYAGGLCAYLSD